VDPPGRDLVHHIRGELVQTRPPAAGKRRTAILGVSMWFKDHRDLGILLA